MGGGGIDHLRSTTFYAKYEKPRSSGNTVFIGKLGWLCEQLSLFLCTENRNVQMASCTSFQCLMLLVQIHYEYVL